MYKHILIPGRHHLLTQFQFDYFKAMLDEDVAVGVHGDDVSLDSSASLVWAVTSSNHSNTQRNPFPGTRREAMIERFASAMDAENYTFHINDIGTTERFAAHIVKEIDVQSHGGVRLTPENTVVATSTPSVIKMFEGEGFTCLPIELESLESGEFKTLRAWEVVMAMAAAGNDWRMDETYQTYAHASSKAVLERYNLGDLLQTLFNDPLLGEEGDITESRNYDVYLQSFDEGAERKYKLLRPHIEAGRILDIGCAGGSLIKAMSFDDRLSESDLYGVEVARPLFDRCMQRKSNGDFGNENVFFHQRNIMTGQVFSDDSLDTIISVSLTHEIESYIGRDALMEFIEKMHTMLRPGGVYLNSDVIGPDNGDETVLLELTKEDGDNPQDVHVSFETPDELSTFLQGLSTYARFIRFAKDFRAEEDPGKITYEEVEIHGKALIRVAHGHAAEYLLSKDYTDSWYSEMHEQFCYFGLSDWKAALEAAGFSVDPESRSYQNDWIVDNRIKPVAKLYVDSSEGLEELPYPDTNVLLIARK